MIEYVARAMPDSLAHAAAVVSSASAALTDHLPSGAVDGLGLLGLLAATIFGFQRGWIVTKNVYEDMKDQRDYERGEKEKWQGFAFQSLGVTEKVAEVADVLTTPDPKESAT